MDLHTLHAKNGYLTNGGVKLKLTLRIKSKAEENGECLSSKIAKLN